MTPGSRKQYLGNGTFQSYTASRNYCDENHEIIRLDAKSCGKKHNEIYDLMPLMQIGNITLCALETRMEYT